ncbi:hypothetical protein Tco_1417765, partial [Tanacetum coccineum]
FDEEERLTREKDEANIALTEEWDDIQAKVDVDYQLAQRLQAQEQEEFTNEEKARTDLVEVDDDQEAAKIKELTEIVPDKEEVAIDAIPLAIKPPSIVDWKIYKEGKKTYYQIIRADGSSKMYLVFRYMLKSFDREDLETLWKLVKAKHGSTKLEEGYKRVLWGDLKGRIVRIKRLLDDLRVTAAQSEEKMVNARHNEVLKASTSKEAELSAGDVEHDINDNVSSSSFEDRNFGGFTQEDLKAPRSMINKQVGKAIKNVMMYYISQITDNLKEIIQKELGEFKKEGTMNDYRNKMETYHDFTACDVPKFDGALDPISSTRWLAAVENAFLTSNCKEKNKVNFASNFLRDSAKMCNETVNELWKKFNYSICNCPEYHGNEKLKVKRFQRMLRDDIREVVSPFKCTALDDLLSRARVREVDLLRNKNKEVKETKRKIEFGDLDAKNPKHDLGRRSGGTQIKTPCKKCHKTHLGECQANFPGCYKCGADVLLCGVYFIVSSFKFIFC